MRYYAAPGEARAGAGTNGRDAIEPSEECADAHAGPATAKLHIGGYVASMYVVTELMLPQAFACMYAGVGYTDQLRFGWRQQIASFVDGVKPRTAAAN